MSENPSDISDVRELPAGQLAIAGVAIAVISMILEFIALSGFAPSVSRDENISRRRFDSGDTVENLSQFELKKRRRRLLKALKRHSVHFVRKIDQTVLVPNT